MRLADLKAKPDANHANAHPFHAWSCQLCHQHCAPSPFAQLVSNPTPPGQITREWPSVVFDQMRRGLPLLEFCKHFGLICEVDSAAYPHIRPLGQCDDETHTTNGKMQAPTTVQSNKIVAVTMVMAKTSAALRVSSVRRDNTTAYINHGRGQIKIHIFG